MSSKKFTINVYAVWDDESKDVASTVICEGEANPEVISRVYVQLGYEIFKYNQKEIYGIEPEDVEDGATKEAERIYAKLGDPEVPND